MRARIVLRKADAMACVGRGRATGSGAVCGDTIRHVAARANVLKEKRQRQFLLGQRRGRAVAKNRKQNFVRDL